MCNGLGNVFTRQFDPLPKVKHKVDQYPLHHEAYAQAKLEEAKSNSFGDEFTTKYTI